MKNLNFSQQNLFMSDNQTNQGGKKGLGFYNIHFQCLSDHFALATFAPECKKLHLWAPCLLHVQSEATYSLYFNPEYPTNSLPSREAQEIISLCVWCQDFYFTQKSVD